MSTSYTHLTIDEREMLLVFLERGLGVREIARRLGRSGSSVSRELARNRGKRGQYSAHAAQQAYQERRQRCVRKRKLDDPERRKLVEEKLLLYWSPEQIDGRLKLKKSKLRVSYSTIYRAIHAKKLDVPNKCLRRGGANPPLTTKRRADGCTATRRSTSAPKGCQRQLENVDFRRNEMSFFADQHTVSM